MANNDENINQNERLSETIIAFHKKANEFLEGKSMIDGYTVTIRDAIEAAFFIDRFKGLLGLGKAVILGLSRQYISKLKNEDKPDLVDALKEVDVSCFCKEGEEVDVDDVLYLGGRAAHLNLGGILGGGERDQLGNLFNVLTRHTPKEIQKEVDILGQMLISSESGVIAAGVKALAFLPDEANKTIVELGLDLFGDEPELFTELSILAANINDEAWKKQIISDDILVSLWEDTEDDVLDARVDTVALIAKGIADNEWKKAVVEEAILPKLSNDDSNVRAAAAGSIGSICVGMGDEPWKKGIVEKSLLPLALDSIGSVAAWSIKAAGILYAGLTDDVWKHTIIKDHIQPRLLDNKVKARTAAVETVGLMLAEINDDTFKRQIVREFILEKLFDDRMVQAGVMKALESIFSTVENDMWKQKIVEEELLPKLRTRREYQTVVISEFHELFAHIENQEWKLETLNNFLLPKLKSQDWYIHSEALKMLGLMNRCIDDQEWKQNVVEEHIAPRLAFNDKDVQAAAAYAIGVLCEGNGTEDWRKNILECHLLPKSLSEKDAGVCASLFRSIGVMALDIAGAVQGENIIKHYLMNGLPENGLVKTAAANAVCRIISPALIQAGDECEEVFLSNLEDYLREDSSASLPEGAFDDAVVETEERVTVGRFTLEKNKENSPHIPDMEESVLINTKTTVEDLEYLAASALMDKPVLQIGPTASRKSALIQYLAFLANIPYRRFNLNGQTDKYEFIGGYKPQTATANIAEARDVILQTMENREYETLAYTLARLEGRIFSKEDAESYLNNVINHGNPALITSLAALLLKDETQLEWQDGILIEALKNGYFLNLDELNLSETEVLERINPLLDDEASIVVYEHENEKFIKEEAYEEHLNNFLAANSDKTRDDAVEFMTERKIFTIHKNFRMFATMNPKEYKGRNKLSDPFLNRWRILRIEELPDAELAEIMSAKYQTPKELVMPVILFHQSIREQAEKGILGKRQREEYHFTIRDLMRVFNRVDGKIERCKNENNNLLPDAPAINLFMNESIEDVYGMIFRDEDDCKKYGDFFRKAFGSNGMPGENFSSKSMRDEYINAQNPKHVVIGYKEKVELDVFEGNTSPYIPGKKAILTPISTTLKYIKTIAGSIKLEEPIHLVGPTASAKTSIVRYLAHLTNSGFQRLSLAGQTDTADIVGQYQSTSIRGRYEWLDGSLLQAMKNGDYLLLDELNLAEPQILERLNSLLDTWRIVISEHNNETYIKARIYDKMVDDGKININDKFFVRIHENFRIIAASNPVDVRHQGRTRLSLAFRNRFREMWMEEIEDTKELVEIVSGFLERNKESRVIGDK